MTKVLVTDRFGSPGPGLLYLVDVHMGQSGVLRKWPLGTNPRYTTIVAGAGGVAAVVSANDKNERGKGNGLMVNCYPGLLQRNATTSDYTVRNFAAVLAGAPAPDGTMFVLPTGSTSWPPTPPTPPAPPTPTPPPPSPPSPGGKKCPKCSGGACGCGWVKPNTCHGNGDGSCCFKCCCNKT